ncbi:MAG: hypothetical protein GY715_12755 [Planctomycetes bacterium]|nr:hypothetical protein [Planctomycetota bacterium]
MPRELGRIVLYLLLLGASGVLVAVIASIASSLLGGKLILPLELIAMGGFWGLGWGGLAIAPLWHRSLIAGWGAVTLPACGIAAILGFLTGVQLGATGGVFVIPVIALLAHRRLPITYPRYPPGQCPVCGYALERLRSRRCPECGSYVLGIPMPPPPPPPPIPPASGPPPRSSGPPSSCST